MFVKEINFQTKFSVKMLSESFSHIEFLVCFYWFYFDFDENQTKLWFRDEKCN